MTRQFSEILDNIPKSGIREFFDLVLGQDDVISLGVGEPDFVTPWNIREEAIFSLEQGHTSYTSNNGLPELRRVISQYIKKYFHMMYNSEFEILPTVGASEGVDIVLRAMLNPGDEVILPEPTYVCYSPLIQLAHAKVVPIDTSKTGFIPTALDIKKAMTKKTKAIVLCSPNNPTGRIIPKKVLEDIAELAKEHDLWVISDEIYAEMSYGDNFHSIASLPGMKERTVVVRGFSKAYAMTGWRIGYILGSEPMITRALKIHQYSMLCVPIMAQYAAIEALKHGVGEAEKMTKTYEQRRNYFVSSLNDMGVSVPSCEGAFYSFPSIEKTGMSALGFAKGLLKEQGVAVIPGTAFGSGGEGHVRCCYACSMDDLKEATKRIGDFIRKK